MRSVAHLSYHQSTLEALLGQGCELRLGFDPEWSRGRPTDYVQSWIARHGLKPFYWLVRRSDRWRNFLFPFRELRTYASYLRRPEQSKFYLNRWEGYLSKGLRRHLARRTVGKILRRVLRSRPFAWAARAVEAVIPADRAIVAFLRELAPDVVVVSPANMRFSEEVEYLKAARALGIPTALPVYSWDNLTTKGLIHVEPDRLLAWNEAHRQEARDVHGIDNDRILVTGSPFFDKWFDRGGDPEVERERYCARVGLDPRRPFVTYLGSSGNIAKDETWVVEDLARAFAESADPGLREVQILVRPHPSHFKNYDKPMPPGVAVWPRPPFNFAYGVPETDDAISDFRLALDLAVATVGINTSAMIEAVIRDRPCIAYVTDSYRETQAGAVHFQQLWQSGALYGIDSGKSCVELVGRMIRGEDTKGPERARFVASFVRPFGGHVPAALLQSRAILALAHGTSPAQERSAVVLEGKVSHVPST